MRYRLVGAIRFNLRDGHQALMFNRNRVTRENNSNRPVELGKTGKNKAFQPDVPGKFAVESGKKPELFKRYSIEIFWLNGKNRPDFKVPV